MKCTRARWRTVLFSDESRFLLSRAEGRTHVSIDVERSVILQIKCNKSTVLVVASTVFVVASTVLVVASTVFVVASTVLVVAVPWCGHESILVVGWLLCLRQVY